jgi:hypothetical protein
MEPAIEADALAVAQQDLAAGDSRARARGVVRVLSAFELRFWDTLADGL